MRAKPLLYIIILVVTACGKAEIKPGQADSFIKFFGHSYMDQGFDVALSEENGYLVAGNVTTLFKGSDILLIQVDKYGNKIWQKEFGSDYEDLGANLQVLPDGRYLVFGTYIDSLGNSDFCLWFVDPRTDSLITKRLGNRSHEKGMHSLLTSQNDLMLLGSSTRGRENSDNNRDILLMKTSLEGDSMLSKFYGAPEQFDEGICIRETLDDKFIIVGTSAGISYHSDHQKKNIVAYQVNDLGFIQDTYTFGGEEDDLACSVREHPEGGFVILGQTRSYGAGKNDIFLVRTGEQLIDTLWTKTIGGQGEDLVYDFCLHDNGKLILVGSTDSKGNGGKDGYFLLLDEQGNKLTDATHGSLGNEEFTAIVSSPLGGYVLAGYTSFENNGMISLTKLMPDGTMKTE